MSESTTFDDAVKKWYRLSFVHIEARERYRVSWSEQYLATEGMKPDAARKAKADIQTSELRSARDKSEVDATRAWQSMLVVRGPMDNARQQGGNWSENG
jgi:hypothetical protein